MKNLGSDQETSNSLSHPQIHDAEADHPSDLWEQDYIYDQHLCVAQENQIPPLLYTLVKVYVGEQENNTVMLNLTTAINIRVSR